MLQFFKLLYELCGCLSHFNVFSPNFQVSISLMLSAAFCLF